MTAVIDGDCRACGQPAEDHDDSGCPATRLATGLAKRGRGRRPKRQPDFVDVPFPDADEWDTTGFPFCWGSGVHSIYCGCRPLTSNSLQDKDI